MEKTMEEKSLLIEKDGMPESIKGFLGLPVVRQMSLMISTAASIALIAVVILWTMKPNNAVLFGGLEGKDATEVMEALQTMKVEFKMDNNTGAILIPQDKLHEVRLKLASQGLPRSSAMGLEMLQKKPEFGTSQFMEVARYQHAIENELSRSITTIQNVESARVHLALPKQSVFVRKRQKASASVLVNLYPGRSLEDGQIDAISHMVASSISDLEPDAVTIVDQKGKLLSKKQSGSAAEVSEEHLRYARTLEEAYIDRIMSILTPLLGQDKIRAQVSTEVDFTISEQTMESYNPDLPALRSEQVSEEERIGNAPIGVPGALSNQPPGAGNAPEIANGGGMTARSQNKTRQATMNYELDKTISHVRSPVGVVKRLSIAVVVDHKLNENGEAVARTKEEMEQITSLVKEAVGYSARRGDSLNVVNAQLEGLKRDEIALPEVPIWEQPWFLDVVKMVLGLILAITFLFLVLRPLVTRLAENNREQIAEEMSLQDDMYTAVTGIPRKSGDAVIGKNGESLIQLPTPGAYEENLAMVNSVVRSDPALVSQVVKKWINEGGH